MFDKSAHEEAKSKDQQMIQFSKPKNCKHKLIVANNILKSTMERDYKYRHDTDNLNTNNFTFTRQLIREMQTVHPSNIFHFGLLCSFLRESIFEII